MKVNYLRYCVFGVIYFQILIVFMGCYNETASNLSDCKILPPPTVIKPIINGEYFSSIEPIILETNPQCQIGRVDKLVVEQDRIFVQDYHQKTLFIFNIEGKYLHKINNVGKGPGEYKVLGDFWVESKNKTIEILDRKKIIRYDYSGNFIDEIHIEVPAFNFAKTGNGNYYIWTGCQVNSEKNGTLNFINSKGKLKQDYFKWNGKGLLSSHRNMFTQSNRGILFRPFNFDYIIREFNDEGIKDKYLVDFGESSFDKDYLINLIKNGNLTGIKDGNLLLNCQKGAFKLQNIFETESFIYLRYLSEGKNQFFPYIYSKKKNKAITVKKFLNENALLPHNFTLIDFADPKTDTFYTSYDAYSFLTFSKDRQKKMVDPKKWGKIVKLLNSITPNSNPIIFKLKINDAIFDKY